MEVRGVRVVGWRWRSGMGLRWRWRLGMGRRTLPSLEPSLLVSPGTRSTEDVFMCTGTRDCGL